MFKKFNDKNRIKKLEHSNRGVIAILEHECGDQELYIRENKGHPGRFSIISESFSVESYCNNGEWSDFNQRKTVSIEVNEKELCELAEKILERLTPIPEERENE